jgi:DNA-binding MarR family transcriptional regulator
MSAPLPLGEHISIIKILDRQVIAVMLWSMLPTVEIPEVRLLLRRFAIHRDRWIDALCRHVGVSRSDYDALEALDEHGSLTPGELGTLLSLTSGSVTALIDRLEKLGWASRNGHPEDRRKVVVTLTQRAWQIGQDELKPYLEAIDVAARQLSTDERAVVVRFIDDLIDKIAHAPRPQHGGE